MSAWVLALFLACSLATTLAGDEVRFFWFCLVEVFGIYQLQKILKLLPHLKLDQIGLERSPRWSKCHFVRGVVGGPGGPKNGVICPLTSLLQFHQKSIKPSQYRNPPQSQSWLNSCQKLQWISHKETKFKLTDNSNCQYKFTICKCATNNNNISWLPHWKSHL